MSDAPNARRDGPTLAVIITTYNRGPFLRDALRSLVAQTAPQSLFEVIVVDDGSTDDTRLVATSTAGLPVRYAYQRNCGIASARNHGVFLTTAPLLLFLDDDDVASPTLISEHLNAHDKYAADYYAVLGYTALDKALRDDPLMNYCTNVSGRLFAYRSLEGRSVVDFTYFWGGRSSCKRRFLLQHGLFNPTFGFGNEDIELGLRLSRHGFRVVYWPAAVSTMVRPLTVDDFVSRTVRQGRSDLAFSRLHPVPLIQALTRVDEALEEWPGIGAGYDAIIESARHLDEMTRAKMRLGLRLEVAEAEWLRYAYDRAFRAARMKGVYEQYAEQAAEKIGLQPEP